MKSLRTKGSLKSHSPARTSFLTPAQPQRKPLAAWVLGAEGARLACARPHLRGEYCSTNSKRPDALRLALLTVPCRLVSFAQSLHARYRVDREYKSVRVKRRRHAVLARRVKILESRSGAEGSGHGSWASSWWSA